jgi:Ca2+-binding EF-hand superfamily protein
MTRRWLIPAAVLGVLGAMVAAWAQPPARPPAAPPGGQPPPQQQQVDVRQFIAQFDRNRDGFLDINEVPADLRGVFNQIDANRDGRLSAEELQQYFVRNPPPPPNVPLADVVLDAAIDAAQDPTELADVQRSYELLRLIDTNNDGRITAEEARAAKPRLIERRADGIIRNFDVDKDGRISRQEAKGQLAQDFDRLDTNKDGFVDKAELIRALTVQLNQPPAGQPQPIQSPRQGAPPPAPRP